jgi:hypothetical protein
MMHLILHSPHLLRDFLELAFLLALVLETVKWAVKGLMQLVGRSWVARTLFIWALATVPFVAAGYLL